MVVVAVAVVVVVVRLARWRCVGHRPESAL